MSRKWIGVVVAILLAAVGTWILVRYVQGAENRALEGEETVAVLVVDDPISAGVPAKDIVGAVRVELVPAKVQAPGSLGSLEDLDDLGDLVVAIDLVPGEQVIASRFIAEQTLEEQDDIAAPDGLLEVTLSLSPERVVGGVLRPGNQVAVFSSFESTTSESADFLIEASDETPEGAITGTVSSVESPDSTSIILHGVLVTNVQVEELPPEETSESDGASTLEVSPTGKLLVTLALEPQDAERLIFTAEFGTVWLAEESDTVDQAATGVQDRNTVYDASTSGGQ